MGDDLNVTILADGEGTAGAYALLTVEAGRGSGPPEHIHDDQDEALLVLEGALSVTVDGRPGEAGAGGFVFIRRGIAHTFRVQSDRARFIAILTPPGAEAPVSGVRLPR